MVYFSPKNQAFYLNDEHISDGIEIEDDVHFLLLDKINSGCIVFADLSCSKPKPSQFHEWNGSEWVDNRTDEEKRELYLASLRPLTRRQFKLGLLEAGLLDQIDSSIATIEDSNMRALIQIEYTEATEFHRTSDSVAYMCQLLGLTDEQVDQMWEHALTL